MRYEAHPFAFLCVFLAAGLVFALTPLALARLWAALAAPRKPGADKNAAYECGLESAGVGTFPFKSEYTLYGILFLVFDVEAVFLLPFAAAFTDLPAGALGAIAIFLLLFMEGLAWAWVKGILSWR